MPDTSTTPNNLGNFSDNSYQDQQRQLQQQQLDQQRAQVAAQEAQQAAIRPKPVRRGK